MRMREILLAFVLMVEADVDFCCEGRGQCSNGGLQCVTAPQCCGANGCCATGSYCVAGRCQPYPSIRSKQSSLCLNGQAPVRRLDQTSYFLCSPRSQEALVCPYGTHCENAGLMVCCPNIDFANKPPGAQQSCGERQFTHFACEVNLDGSESACRLDKNYGCVDRTCTDPFCPPNNEPPVLSGTCYRRCGAPGWLSHVSESIWTAPAGGYGRGNGATQCACTTNCALQNPPTCCLDYTLHCGYMHNFGYSLIPAS